MIDPINFLVEACGRGDFKSIEKSLSDGVDINGGNYMPLRKAIVENKYDVVKYLIDRGAIFKTTELFYKCLRYNEVNIVKLFIEEFKKANLLNRDIIEKIILYGPPEFAFEYFMSDFKYDDEVFKIFINRFPDSFDYLHQIMELKINYWDIFDQFLKESKIFDQKENKWYYDFRGTLWEVKDYDNKISKFTFRYIKLKNMLNGE